MPPSVPPAAAPLFTPAECAALRQLRARDRAGRDLFTAPELARLRFLRWLYQTGRLTS
jgi:hypothetical protein